MAVVCLGFFCLLVICFVLFSKDKRLPRQDKSHGATAYGAGGVQ